MRTQGTNSTQCSAMTKMRRKSKKEWMYVYVKLMHFVAVQQKLTQHRKATVLQFKKNLKDKLKMGETFTAFNSKIKWFKLLFIL